MSNLTCKNPVNNFNDPRIYAVNWIKEVNSNIPINILDVCCACGDFAVSLLENELKCKIWGMDFDENSIEYSKNLGIYEQIYKVDLNSFIEGELQNFEENFDFIFFGDVLEHILFPDKIIKKFQSYLKKDGKIIVSIPNISHGSIKANILLNNFDYTKTGILDETHLKFFTYKSFAKFLSNANLEIEKFKPTLFGPLGTQDNNPYKELPYNIKNLIAKDPYSYIIQFVALCSLKNDSENNLLYSKNLCKIESYVIKNIKNILSYADKNIIYLKKERKKIYQIL